MANGPAIYLLTGLPGTGKYTVARALERALTARGEEVRLVDNHYLCNPIFGVIAEDGLTPLPPSVWERVDEIFAAVVHTIETVSPASWSFIFTRVVAESDDLAWVERLAGLAGHRGARFVPVRLECDLDELCRRILTPARRERMKSVNVDDIRRLAGTVRPTLDEWDAPTLEVTDLAPDEAAATILAVAAARPRPSDS